MDKRREEYCRKLNEVLAPNVKKYREKMGISQEELSILIGKKKNYIKNFEALKYKRVPDFHILVYFSSIFNVEIEKLLPRKKAEKIAKEVGYDFYIYDVK